jgi:MoxR-like ATPase
MIRAGEEEVDGTDGEESSFRHRTRYPGPPFPGPEAIEQASDLVNRLVLLVAESGSGKTTLLKEICEKRSCSFINVNRGVQGMI